jgi:hypothetical protein
MHVIVAIGILFLLVIAGGSFLLGSKIQNREKKEALKEAASKPAIIPVVAEAPKEKIVKEKKRNQVMESVKLFIYNKVASLTKKRVKKPKGPTLLDGLKEKANSQIHNLKRFRRLQRLKRFKKRDGNKEVLAVAQKSTGEQNKSCLPQQQPIPIQIQLKQPEKKGRVIMNNQEQGTTTSNEDNGKVYRFPICAGFQSIGIPETDDEFRLGYAMEFEKVFERLSNSEMPAEPSRRNEVMDLLAKNNAMIEKLERRVEEKKWREITPAAPSPKANTETKDQNQEPIQEQVTEIPIPQRPIADAPKQIAKEDEVDFVEKIKAVLNLGVPKSPDMAIAGKDYMISLFQKETAANNRDTEDIKLETVETREQVVARNTALIEGELRLMNFANEFKDLQIKSLNASREGKTLKIIFKDTKNQRGLPAPKEDSLSSRIDALLPADDSVDQLIGETTPIEFQRNDKKKRKVEQLRMPEAARQQLA